MSRLIWIYAICTSLLLSPVAVKELKKIYVYKAQKCQTYVGYIFCKVHAPYIMCENSIFKCLLSLVECYFIKSLLIFLRSRTVAKTRTVEVTATYEKANFHSLTDFVKCLQLFVGKKISANYITKKQNIFLLRIRFMYGATFLISAE